MFYTDKFYTPFFLAHSKRLQTAIFTQTNFYTEVFTGRSFGTQQVFTQGSFFTQVL